MRTLIYIAIALFALNGLGRLWNYSPLLTSLLIAVVLTVGLWIYNTRELSRFKRRQKRRTEAEEVIRRLTKAHASTLYLKRLQKLGRDDYGNLLKAEWEQEKGYFYNNVIKPAISESMAELYDGTKTNNFIETAVNEYAETQELESMDINKMTPYEFEGYCAQLLAEAGWSARATQGSGDQGIDVIGEKDGKKAVFQVKMYSSPVGNKAVQEVIAGRAYASADLAYVVSNASYTPSAIELASKADVKLLHYSQLSTLEVNSQQARTVSAHRISKVIEDETEVEDYHHIAVSTKEIQERELYRRELIATLSEKTVSTEGVEEEESGAAHDRAVNNGEAGE